jgi:hypothetical protein
MPTPHALQNVKRRSIRAPSNCNAKGARCGADARLLVPARALSKSAGNAAELAKGSATEGAPKRRPMARVLASAKEAAVDNASLRLPGHAKASVVEGVASNSRSLIAPAKCDRHPSAPDAERHAMPASRRARGVNRVRRA